MQNINSLVGLDQGQKYSKMKSCAPPAAYHGFHHIEMRVCNSYQAAMYFSTFMGMDVIAYKGLETGSKDYSSYVLRGGDFFLILTSPLNSNEKKVNAYLKKHGDSIYDVAFLVDDAKAIYQHAVENGAKTVSRPEVMKDSEGEVVIATVSAFGSVVHTFVENKNYNGVFLPGYSTEHILESRLHTVLPDTSLGHIDHIVANQGPGLLKTTTDFYIQCLGFHPYWSIDDDLLQTGNTGLRSMVVADYDETIKIPVNEPSENFKGVSQTQEFVDFHGLGGVQHVAICNNNLEVTVRAFRDRGGHVLPVPENYYDDLDIALEKCQLKLTVSVETMKELDMVVDFDENGYILQIFTRPLQSRPTSFFELMQRNNHDGFGAGNFKSLFSAIEKQQEARGTLFRK
ncbi:4-hydroxyphenylpyruvate dioxygenase [Candidatus Endobugula sertula]|uniref:4-hydroxyphenylpyruvate dioxygenase n=1 Tax=Candidatus Endobugula sertula TaxID=62101 RepID=A0A1D2QQD8_9GAMM|nr:4-hydroxyphenylpyruvate dioxygenase [Candidatus Endobugula sertula]